MYSRTTMDHFLKPRNVGELPGGFQGDGLNPDCGDTVVLTLTTDGDSVTEARFVSKGCAGAIACCSAVTELLTGRTLEDAATLSAAEVSAFLGVLPEAKLGCAEMATSAARQAVSAALGSG